jgi:hypothetical protein
MKKKIIALSILFCVCFSLNAMAADPVLVDCPIDTWTKVATDVKNADVFPMKKTFYIYTVRDTGGAAPTNDDDAVLLPTNGKNVIANPAVDIYIKTRSTPGRVRVFVVEPTFSIQESTGNVNVHDADSHFNLLNLHARRDTGVFTTMGAGGAAAGVSVFDVTTGAGSLFSSDDRIVIEEGIISESNTLRIFSINSDTLTVDVPLENTYTASAEVRKVEIDLSLANGTITTPVIYEIAPPVSDVFHITETKLYIEDGPQPGIELYGGIPELAAPIVFRFETTLSGNRDILKLRSNGDMKEYFGPPNVEFIPKIGGGDYATIGHWRLEEQTASIIRLDGSVGDKLKIIIQDDLTALTWHELVVLGHKEE